MEAVSNAWHSLAIKPEKMRERRGEKTEEKKLGKLREKETQNRRRKKRQKTQGTGDEED
jgi:hypothetical protein